MEVGRAGISGVIPPIEVKLDVATQSDRLIQQVDEIDAEPQEVA